MAKLPSKALIAMAGTAAMKARDYARSNPEKVEQALGKVQGTVSRRTGGKYDAHLGKGSSAVRKSLGLTDAGSSSSVQEGGQGGPGTPLSSTPPPPPPSWTTTADGVTPPAGGPAPGTEGRATRDGA